jgi:hypothetical protein
MAGYQGTSTRNQALEFLSAVAEDERGNINTMIPGEIVSYDATRQKATVQPRLAMKVGDQTIRAPELMEVPYAYQRAGGVVWHSEPKKGDEVMLVASQRSLDRSGDDASDTSGERGRMHSLSDTVAMPSPYSKPKELKQLPDGAYSGTEDGKTGMTVDPKGKKVTLATDAKPDTATHDLNEQLKGLAARVAQAEHNLHGLFDVTSKFREIVQGRIPEVAQVANILNQAPSGLEAMAGAIDGKAQQYLQKAVQQALAKFLSPNLGGLTSLLSGGVEGLLGAAKGQLDTLSAANPVISAFDDAQAEISALASGAVEGDVTARLAILQGQASAMLQANPVIGQALALRSQILSLLAQAGPGIGFLEPQKRLVQGVTKSIRLGGPG